jgi:RNA polymerase sigma factor (sigma-70 family)
MTEPSDEELVQRSLAGEAGAFARLVEKHQRLVFGVALSGARDAAQAEDVAQEAFVEAWRDLPRLRDRARVGSWIAGIARNLGRRWQRHTARRRRRETSAAQCPPATVPTPLDSALDAETNTLLRRALAEIPAAYREVLVLYYVNGRSIAEVAVGLGVTEELVKQRLSRGRRALRASLEASVEGALEQLRPSKAFTATVMAAVGTMTARKAVAAATTGKVFVGMSASKLAVGGVALCVVAGALWYGARTRAQPALRGPAKPATAAERIEPAATVHVRRLASRDARDQLVDAIHRASQQRIAATPATAPASRPRVPPAPPVAASDDESSDDPDWEYIQDAMSGLLPMIVDCYKQARAATPTLAGTLVVNFTIEGEPEVGAVVTESSIDPEQSEIRDPGLAQCVQETMFALEIDPPTNGGTVKVTYPFTFRPSN